MTALSAPAAGRNYVSIMLPKDVVTEPDKLAGAHNKYPEE
jgi:hypothetical protein